MHDTGKRILFKTGAMREPKDGKGRFDLISPHFLRRLAIVGEKGSIKYAPRNWEKGIPVWGCYSAAIRHLCQWMLGMEDEDHLAHAAWNIMMIVHFEETETGDWSQLPLEEKESV